MSQMLLKTRKASNIVKFAKNYQKPEGHLLAQIFLLKLPLVTSYQFCLNLSILTWVVSRHTFGNVSSIAPISLLNRFSTLPVGFVSKNLMGACSKPWKIFEWIFLEALIVTVKKNTALPPHSVNTRITNTPYTIILMSVLSK